MFLDHTAEWPSQRRFPSEAVLNLSVEDTQPLAHFNSRAG